MTSCSSQWRAECEKWAMMDLYHSAIREGGSKWTQGSQFKCVCVGVCVYAGKTVVGPSFMNGERAFVISSPYLVTVLYRGKALFMLPRIKCGSEAWGWNSPTVPPSQIYCLFITITQGFMIYCCNSKTISAKFVSDTARAAAARHAGTTSSWLLFTQFQDGTTEERMRWC